MSSLTLSQTPPGSLLPSPRKEEICESVRRMEQHAMLFRCREMSSGANIGMAGTGKLPRSGLRGWDLHLGPLVQFWERESGQWTHPQQKLRGFQGPKLQPPGFFSNSTLPASFCYGIRKTQTFSPPELLENCCTTNHPRMRARVQSSLCNITTTDLYLSTACILLLRATTIRNEQRFSVGK